MGKAEPFLEADWRNVKMTQRVEGDAIRYRIEVPVYPAGVVIRRPAKD